MYREVLSKSFKNLRFWIFLPDLYLLFVEAVLAFIFFRFSGIAALFSNPEFAAASLERKIPMLNAFVSENFLSVLIYLALFVLTTFILGSSLNSMRFGMIRDIVSGEKFSFRKVLGYGARFWRIVMVKIIVFSVGIITFLFLLGCFNILKASYSISVVLFIITVLGLAAVLLLRLLFLFTYAIMFFEGKGAFVSVKLSFVYFFRNKKFVFTLLLVIFAFSLVLLPFEFAFNRYLSVSGLLSFYTLLFLFFRSLASIFYNVWSEVLLFYSYKARGLSP